MVIPCRNEVSYIGRCLDSLIQSDTPNEQLQVIVVDGQSDDGTRDILDAYAEKYPFIEWIDNPARVTPVAMNLGFKHKRYDFGLLMGAHSTIATDYIEICRKILKDDPKIACVGGVIDNIYEDETSRTIGLAMSSPFGVGNAHFRTGGFEGPVDTVGTPLFRAGILEEVGFFNEALKRNQDDELNYRIRKAGYTIWLTSQTTFKYWVRASYPKLVRQYRQYGYWKVYVNRMHKTVTTVRQLVPMGFLVYFMVGWLPALFWIHWIWIYLGFIFLYKVAAFTFARKLDGGKRIIPLIRVFFLLHVSYGWGYWQGIADFLILRKNPSKKAGELSR